MLLNGFDYVIGGVHGDGVAYATGGLISGLHTSSGSSGYVDPDNWPHLNVEKLYPYEVEPSSDRPVQLYVAPLPWHGTYSRMIANANVTHMILGLDRRAHRSILPFRSGLTDFVLETLSPGVPVTVSITSGRRLNLGEISRSGRFTVLPAHGRTSVGIRLEPGYNAIRLEQGEASFTFFAVVTRWATWIDAIAREAYANGDSVVQQVYSDFVSTFSAMFVDNVSPILKALSDAQALRIICARMAQYAMTVASGSYIGVNRLLSSITGTGGLIISCGSEPHDSVYDWSVLHTEAERSYTSEAIIWPINVQHVRRALAARLAANLGHTVEVQTPRRIDVMTETGLGEHWFDESADSLNARLADEACYDQDIAYAGTSRLSIVFPSVQFDEPQTVCACAGMGARYLDCDSELDSDSDLDSEEEFDLGSSGWLGFDVTAHAVDPAPCVGEPVSAANALEYGVSCWLRGPPCVPMTAVTVYVNVVEPDIQSLLDVLPY